MKSCIWTALMLLSPILHASTSVLAGPHWWRETAEIPSPSPLYSLQGDQAWWRGQAVFAGKVIEPGCVVKMDNAWQNVVIKKSDFKSVNNGFFVYETPFSLTLGDCDMLNSAVASGSRIRVMFRSISLPSNEPDGESVINVQLVGEHGEITEVDQFMPAVNVYPTFRKIKYKLRYITPKDVLVKKSKNVTLGILIFQE